jgi:hypothetical protein
MMALLFLLMSLAMLLACFGKRKLSILAFSLSMIGGCFLFMHHATSVLNISL